MRSVPGLVLPMIRPDWTPEQAATVAAACGVRLGERVELDVSRLEDAQAGLGRQAQDYWQACRDFWDHAADGGHGVGMLVRRQLLHARQSDRAGNRSDLNRQLAALQGSELSTIVDLATAPAPQWGDVDRLLSGKDRREVDGHQSTLTLRVAGRQPWPVELGGPHSRGELTREFVIVVNHAPWRDRRARRLVEVTANAIELWADPAPYQAACAWTRQAGTLGVGQAAGRPGPRFPLKEAA